MGIYYLGKKILMVKRNRLLEEKKGNKSKGEQTPCWTFFKQNKILIQLIHF